MLFLIGFISLTAFFSLSKSSTLPLAKNGVIDLTNYDFNKNGNLALNGEWEFYWNRFIEPDDFDNYDKLPSKSFIKVPGTWEGFQGEKHAEKGFATYRLHVKMGSVPSPMAIKIGYITMAYKMFIDKEEVASSGVVSINEASAVSDNKPQIVQFEPLNKEFDIVLHISNYEYPRGGIRDNILIGTNDQINKGRNSTLAYQLLIAGGLIAFGIYFLILKYYWSKVTLPR